MPCFRPARPDLTRERVREADPPLPRTTLLLDKTRPPEGLHFAEMACYEQCHRLVNHRRFS